MSPDHDPTFDNQAVEDAGHLDGVCDDVLELAARPTAVTCSLDPAGLISLPVGADAGGFLARG